MTRARIRSLTADELAVRDDLAELSGAQRVTAWAVPSAVELCLLNGEPALDLSYDEGIASRRDAASAPTALRRLRRLEGATDLAVRNFVRDFGSLFQPDDARGVGYPSVYFRAEGGRESIASYREIARVLAATLRLVSSLHRRRSAAVNDLRVIQHWLLANGLGADYTVRLAEATCTRLLGDAREGRLLFDKSLRGVPAGVVNAWLRAQEVRPFLTWSAERPEVRWTGGLWGLIGAQLMFAVRAGERMAACDGCGREVRHKRQPKTGQAIWCDNIECARLRDREAKRRSRARER